MQEERKKETQNEKAGHVFKSQTFHLKNKCS